MESCGRERNAIKLTSRVLCSQVPNLFSGDSQLLQVNRKFKKRYISKVSSIKMQIDKDDDDIWSTEIE